MVHPMLEKVARVLAKCGGENHDDIAFGSPAWHMFVDDARAAVRALMEPDEGMVEIGMDYDKHEIEIATGTPPTPAQCVAGQFRAMLAPLLGE